MKASELMAGDWFMFDTEHYEPYERVREYAQVEHFNYGVVYGNSGGIAFCEDAQSYNERKYEKVMPIPLTEAILKVNGFSIAYSSTIHTMLCLYEESKFGIQCKIFARHPTKVVTMIRGYNRSCVENIITYVHELQHALRLCGLDELADNFKITD